MNEFVASKKNQAISVTQLQKMTIDELPPVTLVLVQEQALLDSAKAYFEQLLSSESG